MYDPVDARISQSQTSIRSDGGGGGGEEPETPDPPRGTPPPPPPPPDSPDPPRGSATGRRLQLSKESHSKKEQ